MVVGLAGFQAPAWFRCESPRLAPVEIAQLTARLRAAVRDSDQGGLDDPIGTPLNTNPAPAGALP